MQAAQPTLTVPKGDTYKVSKIISRAGTIGFCNLYIATGPSGKEVVVKSRTKRLNERSVWRCAQETRALRSFKHPNIIGYIAHFEDIDQGIHHLIMEYAKDGDLLDYVNSMDGMTEEDGKGVFRQIISAVAFVHQNGMFHRDIKLENILLSDGIKCVKLADWEFSGTWEKEKYQKGSFGTLNYASPEIVNSREYIGPEVDCWSLGVLLYGMLAAALPFNSESDLEIRDKINAAEFWVPSRWSLSLRDLLNGLLRVDRNIRNTANQTKQHDWLCC